MNNIEITMEFRNCSDLVLDLSLETNPDIYEVQPGEEVVIHAICAPETSSRSMALEWYPKSVNVYPPGLGSQCEDFFVMIDGVRLTPKNV